MGRQTGASATGVSAETERATREFVRAAVPRLIEALKDRPAEWQIDSRWERDSDEHFRERTTRTRQLWPTLTNELLHSFPEYASCVERLRSDPIIGQHLDCVVGTDMAARRLEPDDILLLMLYAMPDDEGTLAFADERFDPRWRELVEFFSADRIPFKTVAPIPHLAIVNLPLQLTSELVLDRLTEDEVTRCFAVGVLNSPRFPVVHSSEVGVGIRRTMFRPKLIRRGGDHHVTLPDAADEGSFGNRPAFREDLMVDDVLSALRLFKQTGVRTAGHATWSDSIWVKGATSYGGLRRWPYGGNYELSADEVPQFLMLWHELEEGVERFNFSIHRFNLAFERGLLADRVVDLVIAAEALLLGDLDVQDRGELRFRFALRAAKLIEHPTYKERDVYRVMRRAYDARSAVVHGGAPKDTRLPDNESAKLPAFTNAIEALVRLGLRRAVALGEDGKKLRQSEYWEDLVLSSTR